MRVEVFQKKSFSLMILNQYQNMRIDFKTYMTRMYKGVLINSRQKMMVMQFKN